LVIAGVIEDKIKKRTVEIKIEQQKLDNNNYDENLNKEDADNLMELESDIQEILKQKSLKNKIENYKA